MEIPKFYFEALGDNHLRTVCHYPPMNVNKGKDIKMENRTIFHKLARWNYKIHRTIYVSIIYYMVPFACFYIQSFYAKYDHEAIPNEE